jgi:hypothetical protein
MVSRTKYALLSLLLAAAPVLPAAAQLASPCPAFQRDAIGAWNAIEPVTVDTGTSLVEVMPGHPVNLRVARILDAQCQ